jgi:hypothetical protein
MDRDDQKKKKKKKKKERASEDKKNFVEISCTRRVLSQQLPKELLGD